MRIFLIGFMGSGKTFIGRQLAAQMGMRFIDLDEFIEKKERKTISQIFELYGEDEFRKIEHNAFRQILNLEQVIIATGGGTPCFYDNMEVMNQSGISIYLEAPFAILAERLKKEIQKRPLLHKASVSKIEDLLLRREPIFKEAHLYYHQREVEQSIDDLIQYLKRFGG